MLLSFIRFFNMYILGISSYYHDSAACLIKEERIVAAVQEERYSRKKHDKAFPSESIQSCLEQAGISLRDISYIGFYDKPFLKFERLLETYLTEAPRGFPSFLRAMPVWLKEKLYLKRILTDELHKIDKSISKKEIAEKLMFGEHHQSHAASCFYPSPHKDSAILTMDGVGEWTTTSIAHGKNNKIEFLKEIHFPHSLGLLYSAFTYYVGFKVNSGEYKLMGLAPYGEPKYVDIIKDNLIDIKADGSFKLNMKYFNYASGLTMTNKKFHSLFGSEPRKPESDITQKEMDIASSIQKVTEEVMIKLARTAQKLTGSKNLVMAGGVALNCVGNGRVLLENIFEDIWIQPAAGDAGGALGVAQAIYYQELGNPRETSSETDSMQGSFLGVSFNNTQIKEVLDKEGAIYHEIKQEKELLSKVVDVLEEGKVVGWFQGRMEFGPRALGARSILGDPRNPKMQSKINLKIKFRESFRPFAPMVLSEKTGDYFELSKPSPYMLIVSNVKDSIRNKLKKGEEKLFGIDKLNIARSSIPAVTHLDYSARVQTVHKETNARMHNLISEFEDKTGCAVLVNTSFNVRGEPIVCDPKDAFNCFLNTGMDMLVIENCILYKNEQVREGNPEKMEFNLD